MLEPGLHYIEAPVEAMPALIRDLLSTPAGLERLRGVSAACKALCEQMDLAALVMTS